MSALIREATLQDAEALVALGRETFIETFGALYRPQDMHAYLDMVYTLPQQQAALSDPSLYNIVVEDGAALVAYVKAGQCKLPIDRMGEKVYELHRIYIRRSHQKQGLGDALMQKVMTKAKAEGADALYLGMWENNHSAGKFYARHGFTEVAEYVFYVGEQADRELILRKAL